MTSTRATSDLASVRAWQHTNRYDPDRAWITTKLFTIARSLVIDRTRRRKARPRTVEPQGGSACPASSSSEPPRRTPTEEEPTEPADEEEPTEE